MCSIGVAFDTLETGQISPIGFKITSGHVEFDVKMEFNRKARWALDGHRQPSPEDSIYAGLFSRESARTSFTCAALNDEDVWACEIQNAYLQASTTEK